MIENINYRTFVFSITSISVIHILIFSLFIFKIKLWLVILSQVLEHS